MSITLPVKATWSDIGRTESRNRFLMRLGIVIVAAVVIAVAVFGFDYYLLALKDRPHSLKHTLLKPGGGIGIRLGMIGFALFFLAFLYPLRKHWMWLGRIGKTNNWLNFHIFAGLAAPIIITFHTSFKMNGIAGVAYWIMMAAVLSGVVGRYFYAKIPRNLSAAEMSLKEMEELSSQWAQQLERQKALLPEEVASLQTPVKAAEVEHMSLLTAIVWMIWLDVRHSFRLQRLHGRVVSRRIRHRLHRTAEGNAGDEEFQQVIALLRRQAAFERKIVFYAKIHKVFNLWHVIHRPFPYSFAVLALIHVGAVLLLGYF